MSDFEDLPAHGEWTCLIGPEHCRWVEIDDTGNLRWHLSGRQEQRPDFKLVLWCLVEGAHARALARRFNVHRVTPRGAEPLFHVAGSLHTFLKEAGLREPIELPGPHDGLPREPDERLIHGMPAWVFERHLND